MKIPNNLLPIHVMKNGFGKKGPLPHHTLYSAKEDLIYLANVYKDTLICNESSIYNSLELANYLAVCANNFPKAIELLKDVHSTLKIEGYGCKGIEEFLDSLENESNL